jgi:RNA recognition motif-containing protein
MHTRLYVGGLPSDVSESQIVEKFSSFGTVQVELIKDQQEGKYTNFHSFNKFRNTSKFCLRKFTS